jgi:hypothetical protein
VAAEAVANRKATEQAQAEETATAQVEATAMIEALNIVLQDDFSSNVNDWREGKRQGDAGQSNFQFVDGKYRVWVKANDSISSWANVNNLLLKDFWLRVEARLIERSGDDPGDTNVSIIFRQNEGDKGHTDYYRVMFYDDSTYRVQLRQDGEWHTVLDRTASRFFKLEPGETNTFSILAEGPKITIYANDQKLHTITDAALSEAGYIGIGLRVSEDGQTATVDFDNLVIRGEPVASADTGGGATPTLVPAKPTATPQVLPAKITKGQIAFVSKRDGNDELYTMDADGSNQQRLTNTLDIIEWLPSWSPDGARLVFECMTKDVSMSNICVINADGSGYSQITNWGQDDWKAHRAVWSPDGQKIAVGGNKGGQNSVILMNADGSNQTVIAEGGYPHWSPDGKQIVFIAWKGFEDQIKVVNIDGSNLRILSQGDEDRLYPTWSPDGSQIAFDYDRAQVVVIDAAGGTEQLIVDKTSFNLSWSSDGQRILIAPYEGLWVVNVDGSGLTQLTQEGTQPAWYTGH